MQHLTRVILMNSPAMPIHLPILLFIYDLSFIYAYLWYFLFFIF